MSASIGREAELAAMSVSLGILLMASYDLLRLFRFLVPHKSIFLGLEDFGYCLYAAWMTFSLLFWENSGVIRAYVIVCIFLAMAFYDTIISRTVFALMKNLKRWIRMKIRHWKPLWKEGAYGSGPKQEK